MTVVVLCASICVLCVYVCACMRACVCACMCMCVWSSILPYACAYPSDPPDFRDALILRSGCTVEHVVC